MPGADQGGDAAKVVVVGMGVENAGNFVDVDAECGQAVVQVGSGIDQIDFALEHQNTGHGRTFRVPAVALSGMDDAKIFP